MNIILLYLKWAVVIFFSFIIAGCYLGVRVSNSSGEDISIISDNGAINCSSNGDVCSAEYRRKDTTVVLKTSKPAPNLLWIFGCDSISDDGQRCTVTVGPKAGNRQIEVLISGDPNSNLVGSNAKVYAGNCSGILFKMPEMYSTRKAHILTAGHCIGFGGYLGRYPDDGEEFINYPVFNSISLNRNPWESGEVYTYQNLVFATMTGADIAIFELDVTYQELLSKGFRIYDLATQYPTPDQNLDYFSFYTGTKGNCVTDQSIPILREGPWTWNSHERMQVSENCFVEYGASGTALMDKESELIYAIAQTIYAGDDSDCEINNPCEVDPETRKTSTAEIGQLYTTPVAPLYGCYDQKTAEFDFLKPSCELNIEK